MKEFKGYKVPRRGDPDVYVRRQKLCKDTVMDECVSINCKNCLFCEHSPIELFIEWERQQEKQTENKEGL